MITFRVIVRVRIMITVLCSKICINFKLYVEYKRVFFIEFVNAKVSEG